jgi:pyruvate/2-oxoglutarate dehydrogenase complex dihydrolipoamide dehydrogenase (E3) component
VIGTGQSGPALAHRLAKEGRRVAIAERKRFGGTCVNTGCIPTKSLIASARAAHVARRAADFGVVIDGRIRVDMRAVKARKDAIVRVSNEGVEQRLREADGITVLAGHARFVGPKEVAVGHARLTADHVFINVGARADIPAIPGLDTVPYLDNSSIMAVDFLPEHLVILGGSYIGLEFGQMYRRFGSEVTIIQRNNRLIPREDEDVSEAIREILEDEGIRILTDADATRIENRSGRIAVSVEVGGRTTEVLDRTFWSRPEGGRTPTISAWRQPASRPTSAASSRSTARFPPMSRASSRWATATAAGRSPTPPTTTSRSSPPICWAARGAASRTVSRPTPCSSIRRSGAPA